MKTHKATRRFGFTLTELLLAIIITGIILTAVASLVFAVGRLWAHNGAQDNVGILQNSVSWRVGDLVRHSRLVLSVDDRRIGLWASDLDQDGKIDVCELVEIYYDASADHVQRIQYDAPAGTHVSDVSVFASSDAWTAVMQPYQQYKHSAVLATGVTGWTVSRDAAAPAARIITVRFTVEEGEIERESTFSATLRSRDTDVIAEILEDAGE